MILYFTCFNSCVLWPDALLNILFHKIDAKMHFYTKSIFTTLSSASHFALFLTLLFFICCWCVALQKCIFVTNKNNKNTAKYSAPNTPKFDVCLILKRKVYNKLFFFVPYLDRACLRVTTPCKSSTPRMVRYFTPGKSFTRPPRTRTMAYS